MLALMGAAMVLIGQDAGIHGTAGICVRWGDDPKHVAEAKVVNSTGNAELDTAIMNMVRGMEWDRPSAPFDHAWMGTNVSIGEKTPGGLTLPNCNELPQPAR